MIAAVDVHYDDGRSVGTGTAVVFNRWEDGLPAAEYTVECGNIQPYVPGEFFRRELPCLLAVISKIKEPLDLIVVDGYVRLNDKPALGQYLFEHLPQRIPVIGVAKTPFHNAQSVEVFRGGSKQPLYVTAIGIDANQAAKCLKMMHGPHRLPTLLKRVDRMGRVACGV